MPRMRTTMKTVAWLILILVVSGAALWTTTPAWLPATLAFALEDTGITLTSLELDRPGAGTWRIRRAVLNVDTAAIRIDDAVLDYGWHGLMAGRLNSIAIGTVEIVLRTPATQDSAPLAIPDLWALVPAERVAIARAVVDNEAPPAHIEGPVALDPQIAHALLAIESPLLPEPLDARIRIEPEGGIALSLVARGAAAPIAELAGTPGNGLIEVDGRVDMAGEVFALFAGLAGFGEATGHFRGTVKATAPWPFASDRFGEVEVDAELDIATADVLPDAEDDRITGAVRIALASGTLSVVAARIECAFAAVRVDGVDYTIDPGSTLAISADVSVPIDLEDSGLLGTWAGTVQAESALALSSEDPAALVTWAELRGALAATPHARGITVAFDPGFAVDFGIPDVDEVGVELPEGGALEVDPATFRADARDLVLAVRVPELHFFDERISLRDARVELAMARLAGERLHVNATLRTRADPRAVSSILSLEADLANATGNFDLRGDGEVVQPLLASELPGWRTTWDLDRGRLSFDVRGRYRDTPEVLELTGTGRVALAEGLGHYEDTLIESIAFTMPFTLNPDGIVAGPERVVAAAMDPGVPLTEIEFALRIDERVVTIDGFGARLLGGRTTIDRLVYDLATETAEFVAVLRDVQLDEVLALEGDSIVGNGVIDGQIPVALDAAGFTVAGGSIAARPPGGYLSYRGTLSGEGVPGLDLAMTALRNFSYEVLAADVEYAADGTLSLAVRLRGASPEVEQGRAIHFNVNVTENIPALLETLRASQSITDRIQHRFSQ